jgi:hypothetical protein
VSEPEPEIQLTPVEYAVYGVLCAAKRETGPKGARRMYRIMERIDNWNDPVVAQALRGLIERGWVRELDQILGMVHYEAVSDDSAAVLRG